MWKEKFNYTYSADRFGYEIHYKGSIIDGLCTNIHVAKNIIDPTWCLYHKRQAEKKLLQILISKKLWQENIEEY